MMKDTPRDLGSSAMSSKLPALGAPVHADRTSEPPGLYTDLAERPEVKALLAEIKTKLKPGEDPLYYALPEQEPDSRAKGPEGARVYVAPTPVGATVKHATLDMQKVRIATAARVNPRAAVTERIERGAEAEAATVVKVEPRRKDEADLWRAARGLRWTVLTAGVMMTGIVVGTVTQRPETRATGSAAAKAARVGPVKTSPAAGTATVAEAATATAAAAPGASAEAATLPAKSAAEQGSAGEPGQAERRGEPLAAPGKSAAPAVTGAPPEPPAVTSAQERRPVEDAPVF